MRGPGVGILTVCVLTLAAAPGRACDIPVYRYALEHWNPDSYPVAIIHHGPMDSAKEGLLAALGAVHANLTVRAIDADHPADESERNWCQADPGGGPRVVVRLPGAANAVVWDGPWNTDAVAAVADSPCRRRIADRLLAGDAAVWVLLQTGRREADDAAADRVQKELSRPAADGQPPLPCSLVCVTRADPAEKLLVETLLSTEPDLHGREEPMAFPVFGRGRVLYALVGAGVNADNVRHTLDFLVGGCSCTIKRQNPGVDLLLTADWSVVAPTTPDETPAPTPPADEIVPLTPLPRKAVRPAAPESIAPARGPDFWLVGGVGLAAVLVAATGWLALRSKKPAS